MDIDQAIEYASVIAERAQDKYGDFSSMHEAYGVLAEEVAELFDAVRMRQDNDLKLSSHSSEGRALNIQREALDVAAVALRIAEQATRVLR